MITNYKLFENKILETKWDRVDNYLKMIRKELDNDSTWDNFMNIDPSVDLEYQDIQLFIIYCFSYHEKKIYELLLKYNLFVEDYPNNDELIIIDIFSIDFNLLPESLIKNIERLVPYEYEKIKRQIKAKKFNL